MRRRRDARGWTVETLASESGVSRGMVLAIEHGTRNAGVLSIINIAGALGTTAGQLLADAGVDTGG